MTFVKPFAPDLVAPTRPASARPSISHKASLGVLPRGSASRVSPPASSSSSPASSHKAGPGDKKTFGLGGLFKTSSPKPQADDFTTADQLQAPAAAAGVSTRLDAQLGPWRFGDDTLEIVEDSAFVFKDRMVVSTAKRRKWFCENHGVNRKDFVYDPDTVRLLPSPARSPAS